ncbi:MAG: divergent polysaccharide deacetylase family protein [bacterium]
MPPRRDSFFESSVPRSRATRWISAVVAAVAFLAIARAAIPQLLPARPVVAVAADVDDAIEEVVATEAIDREAVHGRRAEGAGVPAEVEITLPRETTFSEVNSEIARAIRGTGATVLDAVETGSAPERPEGLFLELGTEGAVTHRVKLEQDRSPAKAPGDPRIAIVFDDLGWSMTGLAADLLDFPAPVTFAILPGLPHSDEYAKAARDRGHEIILHVPMEPMDVAHHDPGDGAIRPGLPAEENRRRMQSALAGLSGYVGVSNHMGSRVTSDESLMDLCLSVIRSHDPDLFFLDSRTTPYSVVPARARRHGVRTLTNNLFLDGGDEGQRLAGVRASRLASIARRKGSAIAIGHVHPETVEAVREAIEEWERQGIRLVPLSDLMHR